MDTLRDDIERLSKRIAEMDAEIEELSSKIDNRANPKSKLYRAMHREHLRLRNTAACRLNELTTRAASTRELNGTDRDVATARAVARFSLKSSAGRLFALR